MVKLYSFTSTITDKSIEEKIVERAASKMRLDQLVIQQGVCDGVHQPPGGDLTGIRRPPVAVRSFDCTAHGGG